VSGPAPWHWLMRMCLPQHAEGRSSVRYPSVERARRVADRHFRFERVISVEHESTGELWVRIQRNWSCERAANDPTWLRANGRQP
jgi:hypothetical protein